MKGEYLGEFEELVLLMVGLLDQKAYGISIVEEIRSRMNRKVNLSAVHSTLYRMEDKGYLTSSFGGATTERGGRRKRIFLLTTSGRKVLESTQSKRMAVWQLIISKQGNE